MDSITGGSRDGGAVHGYDGLEKTVKLAFYDNKSIFDPKSIGVTDGQYRMLAEYLRTVLETNKLFNITAIRDPVEAAYKNIYDSATVIRYIRKGAKLIDVGSGGGFPAVPIAILRPDVTVTALDSTGKKVKFISDTAKALGLENLRTLTGRAEEVGHLPSERGMYDTVTARAVAELNILTEICMPFLKKGGTFIAMKGKNAEEEAENAKRAITALGGKLTGIDKFILKGTEEFHRAIVTVSKTASTPKRYPRIYTVISSSPL